MRYHFTAVFETINDLQLFTKAMLSAELDRSILTSQRTLETLSADIEETKHKLDQLKNLLPQTESPKQEAKIERPSPQENPRLVA